MYSTLLYYNYNSNTENIKHYKFTIWQNHSTNTKSWKEKQKELAEKLLR